jgi:hypothetical protein
MVTVMSFLCLELGNPSRRVSNVYRTMTVPFQKPSGLMSHPFNRRPNPRYDSSKIDMLDIHRLETGQAVMEERTFDLRQLGETFATELCSNS